MGRPVTDCIAQAESTVPNVHYDLRIRDVQKFYEEYKDHPDELMYRLFCYGYSQGQKAQRAAAGRMNA